ncbi:MAG: ABC transporter permease [Planctomycetes bacterium]|nr:ABC transporter permease [Planctomycetota bacterium]MBI3835752.1 ABC transporter permease [Planctomycetota bacterium]
MFAGAEIESTQWSWSRCRDLFINLTWRDIRVRYSQSILGAAWAVVLPLSTALIFTFVFGATLKPVQGLTNVPYPLFALSGLVPWIFFSSSLNACVNCLVANRNLITKVYFPREVFPASCVAAALVDFALGIVALYALMIWFQWRGGWNIRWGWWIGVAPAIIGAQALFALGIGMWLAMANLFYRDVRQLVGVGIQLWMFVSGVVVAAPRGSKLGEVLYFANPMTTFVASFRACILYGISPSPGELAPAIGIAFLALMVGWWWFRKASFRFAECI